MDYKELMDIFDNAIMTKAARALHAHEYSDFEMEEGYFCFPQFTSYIKPNLPGLMAAYHFNNCKADTFRCILVFTDYRVQEMPPHAPGCCPWCEYKWFEEEK